MTPNIWMKSEKFSRCFQISKYCVSKTVKWLSESPHIYLGFYASYMWHCQSFLMENSVNFRNNVFTNKYVLSTYSVGNIPSAVEQQSPTFLAPGTVWWKTIFPRGVDGGGRRLWDSSGGNASHGGGRWSFTRLLAAHLLLCGPVPNRVLVRYRSAARGLGTPAVEGSRLKAWTLSSNELQCSEGYYTSTHIYIKDGVEWIKTQERRKEGTVEFWRKVTSPG